MYAVIQSYKKDEPDGKPVYTLVEAKNLETLIPEFVDVEFNTGKTEGFVHFFDTIEEATECFS